jgi:uncharacterized protein YqeY
VEAGLKAKLNSDLKQALRDGDKVKLSVIRMVLAAMNNAEIARQAKLVEQSGVVRSVNKAEPEQQATSDDAKIRSIAEEAARQATLGDLDVLGIIAKEAKQRQESIDAFKQGNRPDLVAQEEAELAILRAYLPQAASREDIIAEVKKVIAEVGAQGSRDKGKVMPKVIAQLKGRADGREINEVVTELLK